MKEINTKELYNQQTVEEKGVIDLQTIYRMLVLNWQWFVLSVIIALSSAAIYLKYKTPIYQTYAKLLIKDDGKGSGGVGKSPLLNSQTLGIVSTTNGIDNEIVILSSASLAQEAVTDLKLYVSYMLEGRIKDHLLYKNQPINVDIDSNSLSKLKRPITLNITKENGKYHVTGSYTYVPNDPDKAPQSYSINKTFDKLPFNISTSVGQLSFNAHSIYTLPEGKTLMANILPPSMASGKYAGALSVVHGQTSTTIVDITMTDEIPQRSIDYLKQLAVCYNRQANDDKNEIAIRTEQFINQRLEKINNELGQTEGSIESTKRNYGILDPSANGALSMSNKESYYQKLIELELETELMRSLSDYMNEPENKYKTLPANVGTGDETASALISKYNEVVMERNRLLRGASENSPTVTPLTAQLDELNNDIKRAMTQSMRNMDIQRNNLQKEYNKYLEQISSTPEQERVLTQIGRQQEVKSGLYLMLLQKREENSISLAATADKGKLIDEPVFMGKISPKSSSIMLIALVLGLALPFLVLFLINLTRYKIEGHDDVATLTALPIIGDVAVASDRAKTKADIVVHENRNNLMEEIFRSMRANIQFMLKESEKVVMFTSTTTGEGKTFTAANLAVSFALLNKKVILVGLDIRKPRLNELFEINDKTSGITNLLTLDEPTLDDIYTQTIPSGVNKNLDLLMAGPVPPNPAEIVSRESLDKVFALLRQEYDYVIVDTAPVGLVTDTLHIARVADMTVYMCRADYTPKSSFELINSLSAEKKMPKVSIVINGIDMSMKKYGYYYGYGKYGKYAKYGHYGKGGGYGGYGRYGNYGHYGRYGNYSKSGYGNKNDDSIKV